MVHQAPVKPESRQVLGCTADGPVYWNELRLAGCPARQCKQVWVFAGQDAPFTLLEPVHPWAKGLIVPDRHTVLVVLYRSHPRKSMLPTISGILVGFQDALKEVVLDFLWMLCHVLKSSPRPAPLEGHKL
jgi:hypothetical protein